MKWPQTTARLIEPLLMDAKPTCIPCEIIFSVNYFKSEVWSFNKDHTLFAKCNLRDEKCVVLRSIRDYDEKLRDCSTVLPFKSITHHRILKSFKIHL